MVQFLLLGMWGKGSRSRSRPRLSLTFRLRGRAGCDCGCGGFGEGEGEGKEGPSGGRKGGGEVGRAVLGGWVARGKGLKGDGW